MVVVRVRGGGGGSRRGRGRAEISERGNRAARRDERVLVVAVVRPGGGSLGRHVPVSVPVPVPVVPGMVRSASPRDVAPSRDRRVCFLGRGTGVGARASRRDAAPERENLSLDVVDASEHLRGKFFILIPAAAAAAAAARSAEWSRRRS